VVACLAIVVTIVIAVWQFWCLKRQPRKNIPKENGQELQEGRRGAWEGQQSSDILPGPNRSAPLNMNNGRMTINNDNSTNIHYARPEQILGVNSRNTVPWYV